MSAPVSHSPRLLRLRHHSRLASLVAATVAAVALTGCMPATMPSLPAAVPAAWTHAPGVQSSPSPDLRGWWKAFGDERLNALVESALQDNLELAVAASRLRQARLLSQADTGRYLPNVGAALRPVRDVQAIDQYLHVSVDTTWELGLFGARGSAQQVSQARSDAAESATQAVRVSLVAEVVRRYLELRCAQQQAVLLQDMATLENRATELASVRVRTRLGTVDEQDQAVLRSHRALALLAQSRQAATEAAQALAVLTGRHAPDPAWLSPGVQPVAVAGAVAQLPADLLRTRPDLLGAQAAVLKAAGESGLAQAELYPRVSLGLSFLASYNLTNRRRVPAETFPGIGPFIDIPLFDWGRRRAQASAAEEAVQESLLAYRKVALEAVAEAETAMAQVDNQRERESRLAQAVTVLERRGDTLRGFGRAGLSSEFDALQSTRIQLQARAELADARASHALAVVALFRALGGAPLPPPHLALKGNP